MKKSRFTEAQIMGVLRQAKGGLVVAELSRKHRISSARATLSRQGATGSSLTAKAGQVWRLDAFMMSHCPPLV